MSSGIELQKKPICASSSSIFLSMSWPLCLSVSVSLFLCLSVCLSLSLSVSLSVCLSVCLSLSLMEALSLSHGVSLSLSRHRRRNRFSCWMLIARETLKAQIRKCPEAADLSVSVIGALSCLAARRLTVKAGCGHRTVIGHCRCRLIE